MCNIVKLHFVARRRRIIKEVTVSLSWGLSLHWPPFHRFKEMWCSVTFVCVWGLPCSHSVVSWSRRETTDNPCIFSQLIGPPFKWPQTKQLEYLVSIWHLVSERGCKSSVYYLVLTGLEYRERMGYDTFVFVTMRNSKWIKHFSFEIWAMCAALNWLG